MIQRILTNKLFAFKDYMSIVSLTGPRQSGKTTLVRATFPNYIYINLENPNMREIALNDPVSFLDKARLKGIIIDEAQHAPELFSYIQAFVDEHKQARFVLTGSQNFLLSEKINQSLAGRVRILNLLPLSMREISQSYSIAHAETFIYKGGYPRLYMTNMDVEDWYVDYIQTYVERDVRQIININSLNQFQVFLKLCAGRIGQVINYTSLANEVGVRDTTIRNWINLLEASYILYTLKPYYKNFGKRLVKAPKIYFYDTGIACALLDIKNEKQLENHYLKGGLFENFIINEIVKSYTHQGKRPSIYYWRESNGIEIDLLVEKKGQLVPLEIKSAKTLKLSLSKNINSFQKLHKDNAAMGYIVYGGEESFNNFISWRKIDSLIQSDLL